MVQLMSSLSRKAAVKLEADDSLENQLTPLHKRSKLDLSSQVMNADAVLYNRMEEPSPIVMIIVILIMIMVMEGCMCLAQLARQPLFFRESNPQPRKHTLWQVTSDFTGGQASIHRRHFLQCPQGFMGKHYEKLIQCDPRLKFLSQQLEIILESPYFAQRVSAFNDLHESGKGLDSEVEDRTTVFALQEAGPPPGVLSSSLNNECQGLTCQYPENISQQTSSTVLVMETRAFEETRSNRTGEEKLPSNCDQIKVPRFHPSISMSDLVNHIGHCISEQMISGNSILSGGDIKSSDILDEITQYLLGDSLVMSASDEKSLVSRVNSLCCLLPKDPATARDLQAKSLSDLNADRDRGINLDCDRGINENNSATAWACQSKFVEDFAAPLGEASNASISKQAPAMSRRDSVGELLLNLPSISSQPQFLSNI